MVVSLSRGRPADMRLLVGLAQNSPRLLHVCWEDHYNAIEVRIVPGKGRGIFAAKDFGPGEIVLVEQALAVVKPMFTPPPQPGPQQPKQQRKRERYLEQLRRIYGCLGSMICVHALHGEYYAGLEDEVAALLSRSVSKDDCLEFESVERIMKTYCFEEENGEVVLGRVASLFNHSCEPNANVNLFHRMVLITANREVKKGDELCVAYIPLLDPQSARKKKLQQSHQFSCYCARCISENENSSDEWLEFLRQREDGLFKGAQEFEEAKRTSKEETCFRWVKGSVVKIGYDCQKKSLVDLLEACNEIQPGYPAIKNYLSRLSPNNDPRARRLVQEYLKLNALEITLDDASEISLEDINAAVESSLDDTSDTTTESSASVPGASAEAGPRAQRLVQEYLNALEITLDKTSSAPEIALDGTGAALEISFDDKITTAKEEDADIAEESEEPRGTMSSEQEVTFKSLKKAKPSRRKRMRQKQQGALV